MSAEMRKLAAAIIKIQEQLRNSTTTIQLNNSSIEDGVLEIKNSAGETVMEIGQQWDGSLGATPLTGPEPPTPTTPIADPTPGGVTIRWDGEFFDALAMADFSRVEVHVSTDPMLTGEFASTLRGTIETPRGGEVHLKGLDSSTDYYVVFICRSTSGKRGPMSAIASFRPGIRELVAMEAYQAAIDAQAAADASLTAANGKNTITWSKSTPPGITALTTLPDGSQGYPAFETKTRTSGDTWFQYGDSGVVLQLEYSIDAFDGGAGWLVRPITDSVIANLSAGKITTGVLQAGTQIITGDPNATHTVIGRSSLQVFRKHDDDEEPQASVSVGGADQDVLLITDPATGETLAGFNGDGDGMARGFETNTLTVGGTPLGSLDNPDDTLWNMPRGIIGKYVATSDSQRVGTTECGYFECAADLLPGRNYLVIANAVFYVTVGNAGFARANIRYTSASAAGGSAPAPTINSTLLSFDRRTAASLGPTAATLSTQTSLISTGMSDGIREYRFLMTLRRESGDPATDYMQLNGTHRNSITVIDMGPASDDSAAGQLTTGGGTPFQVSVPPPAPPVAKKTYTKTYTASWSRNWRNGSVNGNEIRQGVYSGTRYYGAFGFPSTVQSDLSGATISKMRILLTANHWYYSSGGTAVIGNHTSSSAPGSFPSGGSTFNAKWSVKSGGLWINVPSSWWPYWVSGSHKGFTIGDGAGSTSSYYGRFDGVGMAQPPKLEITYTK